MDKDSDPGGGPTGDGATERGARSALDRRADGDRRRSPLGWLEMRARRDGIVVDRRRAADRADSWVRRLGTFRIGGRM